MNKNSKLKKYQKSIFVFRRDLRLNDNLGLIQALKESEKVLPIFIFDPKQANPKQNSYFSQRAFQFMIESLKDLSEDLKNRGSRIYFFEGKPEKIIASLIGKDAVEAIYVNEDYTPFAQKRDQEIAEVSKKNKIAFFQFQDYSLSPIKEIKTNQGKTYTIFTPFFKKALTYKVAKPISNNFKNFYGGKIKTSIVNLKKYDLCHQQNFLTGGRKEALKLFKKNKFLSTYKNDRNFPATRGTSQLSPHHKFGTISIRETYFWAFKNGSSQQFLTELYWRDFYLYIAYYFPKVFGQSFLSWGDKIKWQNNQKFFKAWCQGLMGVPIIDAGMRQLNQTGWMHNRVRMIVASYLTKNLLIDWRWGEKYFASKLVDYDPASNNGGWQWSASIGADPKPIRIFNPYLQTQKYDPEALYIKKWIPELVQIDSKLIVDGKERDFSKLAKYPKPLVNQKDSYNLALKVYKTAKK